MKLCCALLLAGCLSQPPFAGSGSGSGTNVGVETSSVTAGAAHACAISSGKLRCWGAGDLDQNGLGSDTGLPQLTPDQTGTWTEVAAGDNHTCGIEAGTVFCWGADDQGQDGTAIPAAMQTELPVALGGATGTAVHVFAGGNASCAIDDQAQLWCWGGINNELLTPTLFAPVTSTVQLTGWTSVAIAADHACARTANNDVWCWGDDSSDQLGGGGSVDMAHAVHHSGSFTAIAARPGSTCGVKADASLACWGLGDYDLFLGAGGPLTEVTVDATKKWVSIALGAQHACGIDDAHGVFCWGDDELGAEGKGLDTPVTALVETTDISADMIATGAGFSCDIDHASTFVYCWGANTRGQIGTGQIATTLTPTKIATGASKIAVGRDHTCALLSAGIACWGQNTGSRLVPGVSDPFLTTPTVETGSFPPTVDQLVAGDVHTCLTVSGNYLCWGESAEHQVAPMGSSTFISAGGLTTCVETNGSIKCWGVEPGGSISVPVSGAVYAAPWGDGFAVNDQLAIGLEGDRETISEFGVDPQYSGTVPPTALARPFKSTTIAAMQFAVGYRFGCANVATAGKNAVICWGDNDVSQCVGGHGNAYTEANTFAPPDESTWLPFASDPVIAASDAHACAISNSGNLFCWGSNASLALGNTIDQVAEMPELVTRPGVGGWTQVATGPLDTCAIDADTNLYCWGYNEYGEVGMGSRFYGEPTLTRSPQ